MAREVPLHLDRRDSIDLTPDCDRAGSLVQYAQFVPVLKKQQGPDTSKHNVIILNMYTTRVTISVTTMK